MYEHLIQYQLKVLMLNKMVTYVSPIMLTIASRTIDITLSHALIYLGHMSIWNMSLEPHHTNTCVLIRKLIEQGMSTFTMWKPTSSRRSEKKNSMFQQTWEDRTIVQGLLCKDVLKSGCGFTIILIVLCWDHSQPPICEGYSWHNRHVREIYQLATLKWCLSLK